MKDEEASFRAVFGFVFVLSIFSLFGSTIIIVTYIYQIYWLKYSRKLIQDYVWVASIADWFISLQINTVAYNIAFGTYNYKHISNGLCYFLGFICQFAFMFSPTTNVVLILGVLLPTINSKPMDQLQKNSVYHRIFILTVSIIATLIPVGAYGISDVGTSQYNLDKTQCWINDSHYYLVLYIPITIYIIISISVIMYYFYLRCNPKNKNKIKQKQNVNQMIFYAILFVIQWLSSVIVRWYNVFDEISFSPGIVALFWIGHSIIGVGDAIVWICYFQNNELPVTFEDSDKNDSTPDFGYTTLPT